MRNVMSTIFSQQITVDKLLQVVISGQKSNFNGGYKLKTYNNLPTWI